MRRTMLAVCVLVAACGAPPSRVDGGAGGGLSLLGGGFGGSGGGTSSTGGGFVVGGGSAGGSSTGGGLASCGSTGPVVLRQLHGSFSPYGPSGARHTGGLDPSTRRVFTLPLSVTPALQSLITVRLENEGTTLRDGGSRAFVETLPVSGTLPMGNLTASAFDEQSGVLTGLYYTRRPGYEVVQLQLSDGGAQFTTFQQVDTPDANGFQLQTMFGTSSRLGVVAGNDVRPLSITGTEARWGAPVAGQPYWDIATYDRVGDRVLSIGSYEFVPPMAQWVPTVRERSPVSATWTPISMAGMGLQPLSPSMPPYPYVVWDSAGQRLLATSTRLEMIAQMMVRVPTVLEANLQTRMWRDLGRLNQSMTNRGPFVVDREKRQVFDADMLDAYSLAPGRELERAGVKLTGALPGGAAWGSNVAARRPDGVLFLARGVDLLTFDPATTAWNRVPASVPQAQTGGGASLVFDPVGSRLLMLFGQDRNTPSNAVSALSADGRTFTPLTTMGTAPAPRINAGVVVVGTSLVIAGGRSGTQSLADVHALDLTTLTWRKLGDITPRQNPALMVHDGAVVVAAGVNGSTFVQTIERVELSGSVRALTVTGTAPASPTLTAPFGSGLIALDLGGIIDFAGNQLFELRLSGNTATWTNSDPGVMDEAFTQLVGVAGGSCDEAFFIGPSPFRISR